MIQDEKLNANGELFLRRHPQLKVKVVDGSSLAVAIVLNSIPKGTTQVVLRGNLSKVAYSLVLALCQGGIQVYLHNIHYILFLISINTSLLINLHVVCI